MKQSDEGLNASSFQSVKQSVIEVDSQLVHIVRSAIWKQSWPRERHSEMLNAHALHLINVLLVLMIKVISYIARVSIDYSSGYLNEVVPDTNTFAIYVVGSFNLVGSCRDTPSEVIWVNMQLASHKVISAALRELDRGKCKGNIISFQVVSKD